MGHGPRPRPKATSRPKAMPGPFRKINGIRDIKARLNSEYPTMLPKKKYLTDSQNDFDIVLALIHRAMRPIHPSDKPPVVARLNQVNLLHKEMFKRGWDVAPVKASPRSIGISMQWMPVAVAKQCRLEQSV